MRVLLGFGAAQGSGDESFGSTLATRSIVREIKRDMWVVWVVVDLWSNSFLSLQCAGKSLRAGTLAIHVDDRSRLPYGDGRMRVCLDQPEKVGLRAR